MVVPKHLGLLFLFFFVFDSGFAAEIVWKGAPLRAFIESLNQQGLRVIFSSDLVLDEYLVVDEPPVGNPVVVLQAVLRSYNLITVAGPDGSLLITKIADESARGAVDITVASEYEPIRDARVMIDGRIAGRTDSNGTLYLKGIETGPHKLVVTARGFLRSPALAIAVKTGSVASVTVELIDSAPRLAEVVVTASHYNLEYQDPQAHTFLDRNLMTKLPNLGDEAVRAIAKLPGTTNGGTSARQHVRGGEANEVLFVLDGLRLYEPYHLKDFQSFVTIVDQNAISGIDFYSGGYPARYGDRMSGVMDISLREANGKTETELGLSFFNASFLSIGNFGDRNRGEWLVSTRRGNLDYILDIFNPDYGGPQYQDLLTHVAWQWSDRTQVSANFLASHDKISLADTKSAGYANAVYDNRVLWFKVESNWSDSLQSQTIVSATQIDNERSGLADSPGILSGTVDDEQAFRSFGVKQDWQYVISDQWMLRGGFDYKALEAEYRYDSLVVTQPPFDNLLDNDSVVTRRLQMSPRGSQYAAYVEGRWHPSKQLTLDAGLRWDQQTYTTATHDSQFSPRFSVLYRTANDTEFRFGWGQFYQAQEINELQIRDGLTEFFPAQRAKHLVASASHQFSTGLDLRLEIYRKSFRALRPRFENLFDPQTLIPELHADRVRIDAAAASARGAELTLSGGDGDEGMLWWASYGWAEIKDMLPTGNVKRSWDQTHSVKAGLNWSWGKWNYSATGIVHTGWPKTELIVEPVSNPDGTNGFLAYASPRNSGRYSTFHTLDARISRQFEVSRGELTGFLEITNLHNRENPCCLEYTLETDDSGTQYIQSTQSNWLPLVPSLGVVWRF